LKIQRDIVLLVTCNCKAPTHLWMQNPTHENLHDMKLIF